MSKYIEIKRKNVSIKHILHFYNTYNILMQYTTYLFRNQERYVHFLLRNIKSIMKIKTIIYFLYNIMQYLYSNYVEYLNKSVFDMNFRTSTSVIFVFTL
jgi:hypothetical protein